MDQIIKWVFGLAAFAIVGHLVLDRVVEANLSNQSVALASQETEEIVATYEHIEDPLPGRAVEVDAGRGGHFFIDARVNGSNVPFVIDTGASAVALSYEAGKAAGFNLSKDDYNIKVNTANGTVSVARVTIDTIKYETIRLHSVEAFLMPKGSLNGHSLLGNTFLNRLQEFRVERGKLVMLP